MQESTGKGSLHCLKMDVNSEESILTAGKEFSSIIAQNGLPAGANGLTHIIHNAGIYGPRGGFGTVSQQDMMDVFRVNTIAPLLVAQTFVPYMKKNNNNINPCIAILTSKVGSVDDNGSGGSYPYRASKSACNIVAKSLSIDLHGDVNVVLLHPGYVRTDMTGGMGLIDKEESVSGLLKAIESTDNSTPFRWVDFKACLIPW